MQDASVCSLETVTVNVAKADAVQLVQSDESSNFENTVMSDVVLSVDDDHKTSQCTVQFTDEVDVCKDTSPNLDDTLDIPEKVDDEESGKCVLGGHVPLWDQDGFQCTPSCSQIPWVDPYARKRKSYRKLILHISYFTYNPMCILFIHLTCCTVIGLSRVLAHIFVEVQKKMRKSLMIMKM